MAHADWDQMAYQSPDDGQWKAEFIAAFFVRRSGAEASMIVAQLAKAIGLADDMEARKTIAQRLGPLLDQILPAKIATINIGGKLAHELPPSKSRNFVVNSLNRLEDVCRV